MNEINQNHGIPLPTDLATPQTTEPANPNPLSQYFRHAKLQVELPTQGKFWPPGSLMANEDGTVDVMPMTAKDEIMMKSPEGLMSGSSIVQTIQSCVPSVRDAWNMPGHDVDTLLIAIRMASYDYRLSVGSTCPHCNHQSEVDIDLRAMLDSIPKGTMQEVYDVDGLTMTMKPYTFRFVNENNKAQFKQEQLARSMADTKMTDAQKKQFFDNSFAEIAANNTRSLVLAIASIKLPDGAEVTDINMITEFVNNASRETIQQIRDNIKSMNKSVEAPPVKIKCEECEKEYTQSIEFNQANFFV